jgi:hypothetical protein
VAARRASLHHRDLTTHPGAGVLDRFAWSWVIRLSRLEEVKDVLCARRRPKSKEMVIRISEGPTAAIVTKRRSRTFGRIIGWAPQPLRNVAHRSTPPTEDVGTYLVVNEISSSDRVTVGGLEDGPDVTGLQ